MIVKLSGAEELTEREKQLVELYNNLPAKTKQKVLNVKLPGQFPIAQKIEYLPVPVQVETTTDRVKKILTWGSLGLLVFKFLKL